MDPFFLHVELVCPNLAAANASLLALDSCASATQSATPGVTTYIFYRSAAVTRRLANASAGEVGIEYLEVYLDDESFWGHVKSREWLGGFERLTDPNNRIARHVYFAGKPSETITSSQSWAELNATPIDMTATTLYKPEANAAHAGYEFLSLYSDGADNICALMRIAQQASWVTSAAFPHPHLDGVSKLIGVRRPLPLTTPERSDWETLLSTPVEGQATLIATEPSPLQELLDRSQLSVRLILKQHSGYAMHPLAPRDGA